MSRITVTPTLLLYSPLGLVLVLIRSLLLIYVFLASVILYTVPPIKRLVIRFMCLLLGFVVTCNGSPQCSREQPIVSNCVTLFDHMVLNLLTNCVTPYKFMLSWALTWRHLNSDKTKISDVFHLQPEETPTGTANKIILKFNTEPFRLFNKVQPVAISVSRYLPINLSVHPIDWKYEIFWLLFSPIVWVNVTFLDPVARDVDSSQNVEEFSEIVRTQIARKLPMTIVVDIDNKQFWKRLDQGLPIPGVSQDDQNENGISERGSSTPQRVDSGTSSNNLSDQNPRAEDVNDARVAQVNAVLPDVAVSRIRALLARLGDVDSVIAHLLENPTGRVVPTETNRVPISCQKIAAATFSRDPRDRHRSFAERKAAFLESARQRFIELHPPA